MAAADLVPVVAVGFDRPARRLPRFQRFESRPIARRVSVGEGQAGVQDCVDERPVENDGAERVPGVQRLGGGRERLVALSVPVLPPFDGETLREIQPRPCHEEMQGGVDQRRREGFGEGFVEGVDVLEVRHSCDPLAQDRDVERFGEDPPANRLRRLPVPQRLERPDLDSGPPIGPRVARRDPEVEIGHRERPDRTRRRAPQPVERFGGAAGLDQPLADRGGVGDVSGSRCCERDEGVDVAVEVGDDLAHGDQATDPRPEAPVAAIGRERTERFHGAGQSRVDVGDHAGGRGGQNRGDRVVDCGAALVRDERGEPVGQPVALVPGETAEEGGQGGGGQREHLGGLALAGSAAGQRPVGCRNEPQEPLDRAPGVGPGEIPVMIFSVAERSSTKRAPDLG